MDPNPGAARPHLQIIIGLAAFIAWAAFGVLFAQMYGARAPHGAGFDFELLLIGARRIAAGQSPYDPAMLAGNATGITDLFYTYPPFVAQALVPVAGLPSLLVIAGFLGAAVAAAAAVLGSLAAQGFGLARSVAIAAALVALPFWFPFTLALLFANLDAVFIAADGVLLAAVLSRPPSRRLVVVAGVALAIIALTKLQPVVLGIWLVARGFRTRRCLLAVDRSVAAGAVLPSEWQVAGMALIAGAVVVAISAVAGGVGVWADYVTMLRTGTGTSLLDPRNLGPAAQMAMHLELGTSAVGPIQVAIDIAAVVGVSTAALLVDDPISSFGWALAASLVVLPVTWFHHFAVLLVVLVAGLARAWRSGGMARRRATVAALAATAIGVVGFGTVLAWLLLIPVLGVAQIALGAAVDGQALPAESVSG